MSNGQGNHGVDPFTPPRSPVAWGNPTIERQEYLGFVERWMREGHETKFCGCAFPKEFWERGQEQPNFTSRSRLPPSPSPPGDVTP